MKIMKRLPGTESGTPRTEELVFGCLGLAGIAAILLALTSYARFVDGRDAVVAALEGRPLNVPVNAVLNTPTNVTRIETKAGASPDPNKV